LLRLVIGLVLLTALGIGGTTYFNTRNGVQRLAQSLVEQVNLQTIEKTHSFLQPAQPTLELACALAQANPIFDIENRRADREARWRARAMLCLQLLRANPRFNQVHYGDESKDFVGAQVQTDAVGFTVDHRWVEPPDRFGRRVYVPQSSVAWKHDPWRSASGDAEARRYDPTKRAWYIGAKQNGRLFWTPPYLFAERQLPGITAALPVKDARGRVLGVWGVGFELNDLDAFVRGLSPMKGSRIYIVGEQGEVIAHPERARLQQMRVSSRLMQLPRAQTCADTLLRTLAQTILPLTQKHALYGQEFQAEGQRFFGSVLPFNVGENLHWKVVVIVPERALLGVVHQNNRLSLLLSIGLLGIAVALGAVLSVQIARPLRRFTAAMQRVGQFDLSGEPLVESPIAEVQDAGQELTKMTASLRSFSKFVPTDVVKELVVKGIEAQPGGVTAHVTVLFADIISFSTISEQMTPEALVRAMGIYLEVVEQIVHQHHGILDKYSGDSVMAFWGAPLRPLPDAAHQACQAALRYARRLQILREERAREGLTFFEAGLGIHTGEALVGNIGSDARLTYTAMGDTVNLTSRIEALTRLYRVPILISEATYREAGEQFEVRELDTVAVKGRVNGITLYELLAPKDALDAERALLRESYSRALAHYRARQWDEAIEHLRAGLQRMPEDTPGRLLLERCEQYRLSPPAPDWNAVYVMTSKY
jgi:adenylate cyclase